MSPTAHYQQPIFPCHTLHPSHKCLYVVSCVCAAQDCPAARRGAASCPRWAPAPTAQRSGESHFSARRSDKKHARTHANRKEQHSSTPAVAHVMLTGLLPHCLHAHASSCRNVSRITGRSTPRSSIQRAAKSHARLPRASSAEALLNHSACARMPQAFDHSVQIVASVTSIVLSLAPSVREVFKECVVELRESSCQTVPHAGRC